MDIASYFTVGGFFVSIIVMQKEWKPNPGPQEEALRRTEFEVMYGGARGGGKTDAGLVWMTEYIHHPRFRGLVIRKNADDLSDWVDRAYRLYKRYGVKIAYRPPILTFPSGAVIKTGHLKDEQSYTKYQGHEYQRILIEEATQIPDEKRYLQLISSCRSSVPELKTQVFLTTNPGGVGHGWVKSRFIDVAPPGKPFHENFKTAAGKDIKRSRIFIPALLEDTPQLLDNDPAYVATLEQLKATDPELWKAWRLGSWDVFAGQFFREFRRERHVIPPFNPRTTVPKIGSMDWGYSAPHCFLGSAVQEANFHGVEFNRIVTYKEIYGTEKTPEELAKTIMATVNLHEYLWVRCDPAMFHKQSDGSISIIDQMKEVLGQHAWKFQPAKNDRIGGWAMMHKWLSIAPDGLPYWLITENCLNLIRTMPNQVYDENNVEDIDTHGEDHAVDTARYQQVHLKWINADVGSIGPKSLPKNVTKEFLHGVDLDAFEVTNKQGRDWKSI